MAPDSPKARSREVGLFGRSSAEYREISLPLRDVLRRVRGLTRPATSSDLMRGLLKEAQGVLDSNPAYAKLLTDPVFREAMDHLTHATALVARRSSPQRPHLIAEWLRLECIAQVVGRAGMAAALHSSTSGLRLYPSKEVRERTTRLSSELRQILEEPQSGLALIVPHILEVAAQLKKIEGALAHFVVPEGKQRAPRSDKDAPRREFVVGSAEVVAVILGVAVLPKKAREAILLLAKWAGYRSEPSILALVSEGERRAATGGSR